MDTIHSTISLLAALLAIACPLYALLLRERSLAGAVLLGALSVTASLEVFDLLAMLQPGELLFWKKFALVAEGALPFAWILYSLLFARTGIRDSSLLQRIFLAASLGISGVSWYIPVSDLFYAPDFSTEPVLFLRNSGFAFYLAVISGLIIALVNLEATFANTSGVRRWNIKFEIIGVGALLAGFFIYYSHSFLYRTISMNLLFVKTVVLLLAIMLIGYSRFRSKERVRVHVSRALAYKSIVLLLIGIYLIGLGLLGEALKYFDHSFARSLAVSAAIAVGIALMALLVSASLKRKLQLFLSSHFYQHKYDYRAEWLQFTDRLSAARTADELAAAVVEVFCDTFGMSSGALFLWNESLNGYCLAANRDMAEQVHFISRNEPFIRSLEDSRRIVDLHSVPLPAESPLHSLPTANRVSFAIPVSSSAAMIGFIFVGRPLARLENYSFEDFDLMNTIAHQAAAALLNLKLAEQLIQVREMEVLGKISTFMIHDLKNLVHTLSLMVSNAREYISDPAFQKDMLASLDSTTGRMQSLIGKLKIVPDKSSLQLQPVELLQFATLTASGLSGAEIQVQGAPAHALIDSEQFRSVLLNLILNAIEATVGRGPVMIAVGAEDGWAYIRVRDDGCGIAEDFLRQHLFSPFKTTKKTGLGIGLYQSRQIAEEHNGRLEAISAVGKGSTFTVWLPHLQLLA